MGKTIAQKIFDAHLIDDRFGETAIIKLDRVFAHEITTPPAIKDLEQRGLDTVFDPTKIKAVIDHVTPSKDSLSAIQAQVMRDWARRQNIEDFFDVGRNGVCHALFPEKGFVRPGFTIIMGDSHTCTHGAFGAFACGTGTTALEVGILKGIAALQYPKSMKVELNGELKTGVYAKDVILSLIKKLTVNGATDQVIEFGGDAISAFSMEERMTISNMAVEAGATSGIFAPDIQTVDYLWDYIKEDFNNDKNAALQDYSQWASDPDAEYTQVISLDISTLLPQITIQYRPDQVINAMEAKINVDQVYIGSCTNGRLSDLRIAAKILKNQKIASHVRGIIAPATTEIYRQAMKEGLIEIFMDAGFVVTATTCGACLGMSNGILAPGEVAIATTNRNFNGRMGKGGMVHLASPATAAASAIEGVITDPRKYLEGILL
ncbi:3-isopropylmalate dehydratase large subunit [Candidatus Lokiarchaeum ossiferum]|uniref:3-isopropylmalate dehydratase large subunit n=1 Tax=Candidatus Lokiarchaeum ossiferum TaxID=2951803 RepID=UPI00352E8327